MEEDDNVPMPKLSIIIPISARTRLKLTELKKKRKRESDIAEDLSNLSVSDTAYETEDISEEETEDIIEDTEDIIEDFTEELSNLTEELTNFTEELSNFTEELNNSTEELSDNSNESPNKRPRLPPEIFSLFQRIIDNNEPSKTTGWGTLAQSFKHSLNEKLSMNISDIKKYNNEIIRLINTLEPPEASAILGLDIPDQDKIELINIRLELFQLDIYTPRYRELLTTLTNKINFYSKKKMSTKSQNSQTPKQR